MKVLIAGSSGLVGSALIDSFRATGDEPLPLLRQNRSKESPSWNPETGVIDLAGVKDITAVVNLAGDNISEGRWNEQKKKRIIDSRVKGTRLLSEYFVSSGQKPDVIISASAVGYYGERGEELVDETCESGNGFLADVCRQWEGATSVAVEAGIRVVNLRFGVILSAAGGPLKKMLFPFNKGVGAVIGSGKQYMSWVSIVDVVEIIRWVIEQESLEGSLNLVSPRAVSNREFTKTLGRLLHRPTVFRMPSFVARLAFGEMADELLLASTRAVPEKLVASGYRFRHPELCGALEQLLQSPESV